LNIFSILIRSFDPRDEGEAPNEEKTIVKEITTEMIVLTDKENIAPAKYLF